MALQKKYIKFTQILEVLWDNDKSFDWHTFYVQIILKSFLIIWNSEILELKHSQMQIDSDHAHLWSV